MYLPYISTVSPYISLYLPHISAKVRPAEMLPRIACMGRHFGGLCPSSAPFPCLDGCNTSYQLCAQLT